MSIIESTPEGFSLIKFYLENYAVKLFESATLKCIAHTKNS